MNITALASTVVATVPRWLCARLEERGDRSTKVPYRADGAGRASSTDPSTWKTFAAARAAVQAGRFPLLGFVLGDGFVGIDLDHCIVNGVIEPWAAEIIERLDSYTERSVSGTGVHVICLGTLPAGGRRRGRVEMYDRDRYFVMTGDVVRDTAVADRTDALALCHGEIFGSAVDQQLAALQAAGIDLSDPAGKTDGETYPPLSDDEVLLRAATASNGAKFLSLWRGELTDYADDHSSADLALCSILLYWTQGDREQADRLFRQSNLVRDKWTERSDYRDRTFDKAGAL